MTKVWQPVMVSPYTLPSRDRTNLPLSGRQCWFQEGIYYVVLCRDYILSRETKRILEVLKKIRMTHGMASFLGGFHHCSLNRSSGLPKMSLAKMMVVKSLDFLEMWCSRDMRWTLQGPWKLYNKVMFGSDGIPRFLQDSLWLSSCM